MENQPGLLTLVATPIGNLEDITLRALKALQQADIVVCEDTRVTKKLLDHYHITKKLAVLNDFNESDNVLALVDQLLTGKHLALVSDAGSPLISDPGFKLVREARRKQIQVTVMPGANAPLAALSMSGLPTDRFYFAGFPPKKGAKRNEYFERLTFALTQLQATVVSFEAPVRMLEFLTEVVAIHELTVFIGRELTKIHEEGVMASASELIERYKDKPPRGEVTLVMSIKGESSSKTG